jgi:hypothetical protein
MFGMAATVDNILGFNNLQIILKFLKKYLKNFVFTDKWLFTLMKWQWKGKNIRKQV